MQSSTLMLSRSRHSNAGEIISTIQFGRLTSATDDYAHFFGTASHISSLPVAHVSFNECPIPARERFFPLADWWGQFTLTPHIAKPEAEDPQKWVCLQAQFHVTRDRLRHQLVVSSTGIFQHAFPRR